MMALLIQLDGGGNHLRIGALGRLPKRGSDE